MTILILHLICCAFLTGLIWTIQFLHYPAFAFIEKGSFVKFHAEHSRNITFIVAPAMVFELLTAIVLVLKFPEAMLLVVNLALVILIWLCTFFLSVPVHNSLARGADPVLISRLVATNWFRTFLWSLRLLLLIYFLLLLKDFISQPIEDL